MGSQWSSRLDWIAGVLSASRSPCRAEFAVFPSSQRGRTCLLVQETQETWVWSLGPEGLLEEEMATHSSILAWEFQGKKSLAGYIHRVAKSPTQLSMRMRACVRAHTHSPLPLWGWRLWAICHLAWTCARLAHHSPRRAVCPALGTGRWMQVDGGNSQGWFWYHTGSFFPSKGFRVSCRLWWTRPPSSWHLGQESRGGWRWGGTRFWPSGVQTVRGDASGRRWGWTGWWPRKPQGLYPNDHTVMLHRRLVLWMQT